MIVIGAGMAGLLAAAMLRNECSAVIEAQPKLPNNHSALLRFRSSIVGDTLNIPFKRVQVLKAVHSWRNPVADALRYSFKTNGMYTLRSSITGTGELVDRWIAPPDLVSQMQDRVMAKINFSSYGGEKINGENAIISTIPMPMLMDLLMYDGPKQEFQHAQGFTVSTKLEKVDAYVSLYIPTPDFEPYRVSITGDTLLVEIAAPNIGEKELESYERDLEYRKDSIAVEALKLLGIQPHWNVNPKVKRQKYAKILPIDEAARRRFILWATEKYKVYSLGRFATWRPHLLLDDLVNDIRVIQQISREGNYAQRRGRAA